MHYISFGHHEVHYLVKLKLCLYLVLFIFGFPEIVSSIISFYTELILDTQWSCLTQLMYLLLFVIWHITGNLGYFNQFIHIHIVNYKKKAFYAYRSLHANRMLKYNLLNVQFAPNFDCKNTGMFLAWFKDFKLGVFNFIGKTIEYACIMCMYICIFLSRLACLFVSIKRCNG